MGSHSERRRSAVTGAGGSLRFALDLSGVGFASGSCEAEESLRPKGPAPGWAATRACAGSAAGVRGEPALAARGWGGPCRAQRVGAQAPKRRSQAPLERWRTQLRRRPRQRLGGVRCKFGSSFHALSSKRRTVRVKAGSVLLGSLQASSDSLSGGRARGSHGRASSPKPSALTPRCTGAWNGGK
jgi:hypothetical protein